MLKRSSPEVALVAAQFWAGQGLKSWRRQLLLRATTSQSVNALSSRAFNFHKLGSCCSVCPHFIARMLFNMPEICSSFNADGLPPSAFQSDYNTFSIGVVKSLLSASTYQRADGRIWC